MKKFTLLPLVFHLAFSGFQPADEAEEIWFLEHYDQKNQIFFIENEKDDLWGLEHFYESPEESSEQKREVKLLAQLVQAEAGNQDLKGMRLVVDVVLNRVDSSKFPNTIEEVIFQKDPVIQFSVIEDGAFERAGDSISENALLAAEMELEERLDYGVLYFSSTEEPVNGKMAFKHQDHWFGY